MPPVEFRRAAKSELRDAARWYEERRPGLGTDFLRGIDACLNIIRSQPEIFPVVYKNVRRGSVKRFPFTLLYSLSDERIVVLAVFHTSRDPDVWKKRL